MGCKTCKQKKEKKEKSGVGSNLNAINNTLQESGLENGVFVYKLLAFIVVTAALPLILVVQLFLTLFLPKKLPTASKKFKDFCMGIFSKYAEFKVKRTLKKRERQFKKTTEYVNNDIEEVEIYDNEEQK